VDTAPRSESDSLVKIGPAVEWPPFPKFSPGQLLNSPTNNQEERINRRGATGFRDKYDWTIYTESGLAIAEQHWDTETAILASLLPERLRTAPSTKLGINLGTFNGAYQKSWMRRGHPMYGVEKADVIAELHAYGCEGHRDDVFDLSRIPSESFDFAVLDRVLCSRGFYLANSAGAAGQRHAPPYFHSMVRIVKPGGAFIGLLYQWYTREFIEELASYGALTLWPLSRLGRGMLAFQVDLGLPPSVFPDPSKVSMDSVFFTDALDGRRLFIPTNEIVTETPRERRIEFAPAAFGS
jgi:hypothetical protein